MKAPIFDDTIGDMPEMIATDLNIKPEFYIHKALLKAQDCLTKENVKEGFLQYRVMIEYIEILCRAASLFPENYNEKIEQYKESKEYSGETQADIKAIKLANIKLNLLMEEVFSTKLSTDALAA